MGIPSKGLPQQMTVTDHRTGVVLGVAVLPDAFLVPLGLPPVLLRLTGRAAWYRPVWLHRVLPDVRFSHD